MEILSHFVQLPIIMAERDRQHAGGPVSFHQRISNCSKIVVTVVNLISHKPRFHTGLRAVRQSNGFIVGIILANTRKILQAIKTALLCCFLEFCFTEHPATFYKIAVDCRKVCRKISLS